MPSRAVRVDAREIVEDAQKRLDRMFNWMHSLGLWVPVEKAIRDAERAIELACAGSGASAPAKKRARLLWAARHGLRSAMEKGETK